MAIQMLDAITFPLFGKRLIEASAGTGKTYTIANLYLRLLLPLTSENNFARPLTVDQILVVTFTEAATAELKARIRLRIRQARKALLQSSHDEAMAQLAKDDVFLSQLLLSMNEQQIASGIEYLLYAEKQMDEAAIFTIHGFCQRMLSQNAFESRMLFQQSIETDDQTPLAMAVKDVWRTNIYPMSPSIAALVKPIWSGPEALQKELRLLQNQPDVVIQQNSDALTTFSLTEHVDKTERFIQQVKTMWLDDAANILAAMNESGLDGRFWAVKKQEQVAQTILNWSQNTDFVLPKELEKFHCDQHKKKVKKNGALPIHPFFELVASLYDCYPTLEKIKPALLKSFWQQVQERLMKWQQQTQKLTFNELLTGLDHALTVESAYPLSERIRQLYPIAMIDEFQDTDPIQFRIFNRIYEPANGDSRQLGLIMIGDPKQAIYAFRGADIYTYLSAKNQVDAIYALSTNYRSSAAMVQSVNALFDGHKNPFKMTGIPFVAVEDRATKGAFYRQGKQEPALQLLLEEGAFGEDAVVSPAQYQLNMAEHTGEHIAQLLLEASKGEATLAEKGRLSSDVSNIESNDRPVYSGDIAILVSGYRQAQLVKKSLAKRGVASVYLSDRGSVFSSNEASDLLIILNAILSEGKEVPIRSALATDLLGWSVEELDALNQNDLLYEEWVGKFQQYYSLWDQHGILPMLRALMQELDLPQKLLSSIAIAANSQSASVRESICEPNTEDKKLENGQSVQGERRLTDLLHLGEKLQQKSLELESKEGLIRYLALAIQSPNGDSDEQKIRLETDDDLVRIITIHKSKGLEYPIVYLPFACMPFRNSDKHALYHDAEHQLHYAPIPEEDQKERHEAELYASEIRLAYVALTRAREVCYIGCAQVGKMATKSKEAELSVHLSGVGALLSRGKRQELGEFKQTIGQWLDGYPTPLMSLALLNDATDTRIAENGFTTNKSHPTFAAKSFTGHIERDWWVGSYSSLVVGTDKSIAAKTERYTIETTEPGLDEFTRIQQNENHHETKQDKTKNASINTDNNDSELFASLTPFTFPKGAKPGTFLHDLLEGKALQEQLRQVAFADLLKAQYQTAMINFIEKHDYGPWQQVLFTWLQDILSVEIIAGLSLQSLTVKQCQKEMEFFLPVAGFNARQLDSIARQYDPLSKHAPFIQDQSLKGMLKGFIDLLFEHEGKYYVLDYKSNHLGMQLEDYQTDSMALAMAEHRYDLQYQLYTLALHRFLSQRLPDYDYDKHVGGVCYLFLRGLSSMQNTSNSGQHVLKGRKTGVFSTRLTKEHVEALDNLLQGKDPSTIGSNKAASNKVNPDKKASADKKTSADKKERQNESKSGGQYDLF